MKNTTHLFSSDSTLFAKTPGGWEGQFDAYPSLPSVRAESRSQPPLRLRLRELCVLCGLCVNSDSLLDFQPSTFYRRSRPYWDCQLRSCALCLSPRFRTQYNCFFTNKEGTRHGHRRTENSYHGVHQRAFYRLLQARNPQAHGGRAEKSGLRIRP